MKLLVVSHNVPFPPNKGEKIRTYHLLRELAREHDIHLIALARDPSDLAHTENLLEFCERVELCRVDPIISKVYALVALVLGLPMTFGFFFSFKVKRLVRRWVAESGYDAAFAICSSAGPYLYGLRNVTTVIDYIDVDSAKWHQYAQSSRAPQSWIYAVEHKRLGDWEARLCRDYDFSLLTSETEKQRLAALAPGCNHKIVVCPNGIDTEFFTPAGPAPVDDEPTLVFTGQMDYLPNVDAAKYFYREILPLVRQEFPQARFVIVGRNPTPELHQCCPDAEITGEVDDIRPYVRNARVFVAPLRLAFGVQNKVLEAMACRVPVIATSQILSGMETKVGQDLLVGDDPITFAQQICSLLSDDRYRDAVAQAGYEYVHNHHDWPASADLITDRLRVG